MYSKNEMFYDSLGNLRSPGASFYDGKGILRSVGEEYYDYDGCLRYPGEEFYDGEGNLRYPGEDFIDGQGHWRSSGGENFGLYIFPRASSQGLLLNKSMPQEKLSLGKPRPYITPTKTRKYSKPTNSIPSSDKRVKLDYSKEKAQMSEMMGWSGIMSAFFIVFAFPGLILTLPFLLFSIIALGYYEFAEQSKIASIVYLVFVAVGLFFLCRFIFIAIGELF